MQHRTAHDRRSDAQDRPDLQRPLRVALTSYRSKPHCGGQGIYVRYLSKALVQLGHEVEVFSGPPYPDLVDGVRFTEVPSLDLYNDAHPFRIPQRHEFRDLTDLLEFATMCTAGFPEPRTFSRRVVPMLRARAADFDVVHDNQTYGPAMTGLLDAMPFVGTLHHPISVDRRLDLAAASWHTKPTMWRWYGFLRAQARTARRVGINISPSSNSVSDAIRDFGMRPEQFRMVPMGVDIEHFRPRGERERGRLVAMCSADVPLKGLAVLLRALALLPTDSPAHLFAVTKVEPGGPTEKLVAELGVAHRVTFVSGLSDDALAELMAGAEIAVVPSLYEGFSLPAVEAMASGTPLVASDTASLPEVVGRDGSAGLLVPPSDPAALAAAVDRLLGDPQLRARVGAGARERAVAKFSWPATAARTVEVYREAIAAHRPARTTSEGR